MTQPVCPSSPTCPSVTQPVRPWSPQSVGQPVHQLHCQSMTWHVCLSSPSIIPICPSYDQSVQHTINSSLTHLSVTPPVSPAIHPSDHPSMSDHLYAILPHLSGCPSSSDHSSTIYTSLSDHPSPPDCLYDKPLSLSDRLSLPDHLYDKPTCPSACPSLSDCLTATTTHPAICLSSTMIQCTQDSSQSLAVVNGEQSR